MSDETAEVLFDVDGRVGRITINRPERRNALNPSVVHGIGDALERAERTDDISLVVLTGSGDKAFCAGGDLGGMAAEGSVAQHFERAEVGELFQQMRRSRMPIVAAVNGHALAGGFGLMLACDLVIAAAEAEMGMPEINLGLWPFMVTAMVRRDLPRKLALDLMLTGRRIGAAQAQQWGFVNRVTPRAELDHAVAETVDQLLSKSPLILALGKRSFYRAEDLPFDDSLEYLSSMLTLCLQSEDTVEGVTAFLQKRPPEWKGR